jgi:hypothetical protein
MAEVRINGRRFPILQAVDSLQTLVARLDAIGLKEGSCLTQITVNGMEADLDKPEALKATLIALDRVDARMESSEQMALQSLQVAQEMAELLVFDIKVATLSLWDNSRSQQKSLESLLQDCSLFLTLAARPVELLGQDPRHVEKPIEECLRLLDRIANGIEGAVLLATNNQQKDACRVLVSRVMPNIENWLKATSSFADELQIGSFEFNVSGDNQHRASL